MHHLYIHDRFRCNKITKSGLVPFLPQCSLIISGDCQIERKEGNRVLLSFLSRWWFPFPSSFPSRWSLCEKEVETSCQGSPILPPPSTGDTQTTCVWMVSCRCRNTLQQGHRDLMISTKKKKKKRFTGDESLPVFRKLNKQIRERMLREFEVTGCFWLSMRLAIKVG